jgi:hypothetical protein
MSGSAERWIDIVPKKAIKEAIHMDVIPFKSIVPYLEVRQRCHSRLRAQVRYVVIFISSYCSYNFLMLIFDVFCKFVWQQI